jgi:ureidoglycolate hydrolase
MLQDIQTRLVETARHTVRAQELTDVAFAPYGDIIKPRRSGEQFDRSHTYRAENEDTHVKLVMTEGAPVLRIMDQRLRGLAFSKMARHLKVSQCLGSLEGKDWFIAVAAPSQSESVALSNIAAFRIPGDRIIKLHVGTWHAGPHFTHDECLFLNLENIDTNSQDFHAANLPRQCQIVA